MNTKNWYLARLWRHNKKLFVFVLLFIFFQLYFNQKRVHSFPWFVWDMYSRENTLPDIITQTEVFIDGERLDVTKIPIWQEATILHTYQMYNSQRFNNHHDPMDAVVKRRTRYFPDKLYHYVSYKINNHKEETEKYPFWLKQYLENLMKRSIKTVELKDVQYKYRDGNFLPVNNSITVLKIGE